jgi:TM2 domain-containing membrane protein YozV
MDIKCPKCRLAISIDETQYDAGTVLKVCCPRCEEEIPVTIPEHQKKQIEVISAPPKKEAPTSEHDYEYYYALDVEVVAPTPVYRQEDDFYDAAEVEEIAPAPVAEVSYLVTGVPVVAPPATPVQQQTSLWDDEPVKAEPKVTQGQYVYTNKKSKSTTTWLSFLLGGFGGHWFYLGKNGMGAAHLLAWFICLLSFGSFFFTYSIVVLGEWLYFLAMSKEDFDKKYNSR